MFITQCVFIKKTKYGYVIIAIFVNCINLVDAKKYWQKNAE